MEGSVPCYKLGSQELSSNSESGTIPYSSGDISMNDLKMCLNEISVEDVESPASGLLAESNSKCGLVMEYDCKVSDEPSDSLLESTSSVEGLLPGEKGRDGHKTSEANACDKSVDQCYPPPNSSATRSKLKSAMKGSREKQGIPPKKLSVTWAPDVYDPIPTSVSHVPSSRNQYRNNGRKYGKNKQKGGGGKNSRGGKGKDKKQARKNGGTTTKFKPVHDDSMASFSKPESGIIDFNVVSTDPFCGSSFLKETIQNMHFPVAEATR